MSDARYIADVAFDVYVRKVRSFPAPDMGQLDGASSGAGGWEPAYDLRVREVRLQRGPQPGWAVFDYVPGGDNPASLLRAVEPIEAMLERYGVDDQVRVVKLSRGGGQFAGDDIPVGSGEDTGIVIFEGVLSRHTPLVERSGEREREQLTLTAIAAPQIDNGCPDRIIRGRWLADPSDPSGPPLIVDGPSVPAVFNAGGRPNMHPDAELSVGGGGQSLSAKLYASEGDPAAIYWTVRDALMSVCAVWMYGPDEEFVRSAALEPDTHAALSQSSASGERWEGLDGRMPSLSVQGLGVYDAIEKICQAVGYGMALTPTVGRTDAGGAGGADRLYELRLWRKGAGPKTDIKMMRREDFGAAGGGAGDDQAAAVLEGNNVSMFRGLRDSANVRNWVIAVGRAYIEASFPLKPLWAPDAIDMAEVADQHGQEMVGQQGEAYHQRHVAGGHEYAEYGHVGRAWGLDCTGQLLSDSQVYDTPALYAQETDGFDFLAFLGIDGSDAISDEREARSVT